MRPLHFTLPNVVGFSPIFAIGLALVFALPGAILSGCADHAETAYAEPDSTMVYAAKDPDGIKATITLCRKIGKKSGKPIGVSRAFTSKQKGKVRALIELENLPGDENRLQTFHFVWVRPDGKSVYRKRIEHQPDGSTATLKSAISITPGKRPPGTYTFRVYHFRELIAEKTFELHDPPEES